MAVLAGVLITLPLPALATAPWQSLTYRQASLWGEVSVELTLQPSEQPAENGPWRLQVSSSAGNNREQLSLWLADPWSGILLKERYSEGRQNRRFKSFDYRGAHIRRLRKEPADGEEQLPHVQWSRSSVESVSVPQLDGPLHTPYLLLVLATAPRLAGAAGELTAYLHTDYDFYRATLYHRGQETIAARYRLLGDGSDGSDGRLVDETVTADRIGLRIEPVSRPGRDDFEFMGLRDEIHFLVERDSRLPLRISGKDPLLGEVRINLVGAAL